MALEQAPDISKQVNAASDLSGSLDFVPRPTAVADMGTSASLDDESDDNFINFAALPNIYGQDKRQADNIADSQKSPSVIL